MQRFRRHLFRERRRLALFAGSVTLAAFLIASGTIGQQFDVRNAAFVALGTGLGAGLIALGVLMVAPGWRHALETVGFATFLYAIAIQQVPGLSFHRDDHSLAAFVGFLAFAAVLHLALYGRWSDRLLRLPLHVERATCLTRLDRPTVWAAALPTPATTSNYWDRTVHSIAGVADAQDEVIVSHRFETGLMLDQRIRFEQVVPGKSFRYAYAVVGGRQRGPQSFAVVLEDRGGEVAIHLRWERTGYPLRLTLMHWIDDWGGRVADRQLEHLEAQVGAATPLPQTA